MKPSFFRFSLRVPGAPLLSSPKGWGYIQKFMAMEASGGLVLLAAAVLAMGIENSPASPLLHALLRLELLGLNLQLWINDGLMAVFFLLIGLELKRERLEGHLTSLQQCLLPAIAACGGVIAPAIIFQELNHHDANAIHGWAIPTATDIAFALCVMQLLGKSVPQALKVTLVTIAIIDDLIAVLIIALFYTVEINLYALGSAGAILGILGVLNHQKVTRLWAYLLPGAFLWVCVLQSGVHATIAGVVLALFIPLRVKGGLNSPIAMLPPAASRVTLLRWDFLWKVKGEPPAKRLEHALHPYVAYGIMPLFALANAGVSLAGISLETMREPITLGILLGLFLGKQIGVMLASGAAVALGICRLPQNTRWGQYYGMAVLCGIGFTMSLFIGGLSYDVASQQQAMKLGVLAGSVLASVVGFLLLRALGTKR